MDNSIQLFDLSDSPKQFQNITLETFESWNIDFGMNSGLLYTCGNNGNISAIGYESGDVEFEARLSDEFHMPVKGRFSLLVN